jgi:hypothetical protein
MLTTIIINGLKGKKGGFLVKLISSKGNEATTKVKDLGSLMVLIMQVCEAD